MKIGVKIFVEIHFTLRNKRQKLVYEKKKKKRKIEVQTIQRFDEALGDETCYMVGKFGGEPQLILSPTAVTLEINRASLFISAEWKLNRQKPGRFDNLRRFTFIDL